MKKNMYKNNDSRKYYLFLLLVLSSAPLLVLAAAQDNTFVPLTGIPGFGELGSSPSLPVFLNSLYKLAIGAAAVIAVLQIMRAGVLNMTNSGSTLVSKESKELIQNAIIGLVLVLSPYVVFSVINPSVNNLNLDVSGLQSTKNNTSVETVAPPPVSSGKVNFTDPSKAPASCMVYNRSMAYGTGDNACTSLGAGFEKIDSGCCANSVNGFTCCGKKI